MLLARGKTNPRPVLKINTQINNLGGHLAFSKPVKALQVPKWQPWWGRSSRQNPLFAIAPLLQAKYPLVSPARSVFLSHPRCGEQKGWWRRRGRNPVWHMPPQNTWMPQKPHPETPPWGGGSSQVSVPLESQERVKKQGLGLILVWTPCLAFEPPPVSSIRDHPASLWMQTLFSPRSPKPIIGGAGMNPTEY